MFARDCAAVKYDFKVCKWGKVALVYAPYVCNDWGAEHVDLVVIEEGKTPGLAAAMKCKSCEGEMEFDDLV